MSKVTERIQISITPSDRDILDKLKIVFRQKSYSSVVQLLIRYHENGKF